MIQVAQRIEESTEKMKSKTIVRPLQAFVLVHGRPHDCECERDEAEWPSSRQYAEGPGPRGTILMIQKRKVGRERLRRFFVS